METHSSVKVTVHSRLNAFKTELNCLVLHQITQDLPVTPISSTEVQVPPGITLADPSFRETAKIDMLIGTDIFWGLICIGQIKATTTPLWWQKTHFGWIAAGRFSKSAARVKPAVCNLAISSDLNATVARFWEIEHGARLEQLSPTERKCEAYFEKTVKRDPHGRFIVKLPIKDDEMSRLGESRTTAIRRFEGLERRLSRDAELKREYSNFIHEYEALGHMRKRGVNEADSWPHYYMPHHCVIKKESSTTKVRVVFDASCKTSTGISLNDALVVEPVLQQNLFSITARFRIFKYVLIADVEKMYRQVLIDESQTALQRIVWRDSQSEQLQDYELCTVTYGTAPASFLAIKALRTLAENAAKEFPVGSKIVLRDFYVDDLITGASTRAEALRIIEETTGLLGGGGFQLRKWASNDNGLLERLHRSTVSNAVLSIDKEGTCKTLGIQWCPTNDALQYSVTSETKPERRVTKRTILSRTAQIFDPLGLLGPIIVSAKILLQKMWTLRLDWDESLPVDLHSQWTLYTSQLQELNELRIPRRAAEAETIARLEVHGFCDASQEAYGACVYLRVTDRNGANCTRLLCSKSRVAPLKTLSIPRLELCGAQLLAQLIDKIRNILEIQIDSICYWTDSTIVLDWIKAPSRMFNVFVANRIGEIQELTSPEDWKHVNTNDNPADILSRGALPEAFRQAECWWTGPSWLNESKASWPKIMRPTPKPEELPEQRRLVATIIQAQREWEFVQNFSSYTKLLRIVAICARFASNTRITRGERPKRLGAISAQELEEARKRIVKQVQRSAFPEEVDALAKGEPILRRSQLLSLSPFLDHEGLLRVGGRLRNSSLAYSRKHPLIVPGRGHFMRLIVEYEHKRRLHAGYSATLAAVRLLYWPLAARGTVRNFIRKCVICFKAKPHISQQIMGDLPAARVTPGRPFASTGVDYCGPIHIKESKRRNAKTSKAWIAIFVCLATKAIHIELVTDLSADGFIAALRRFIGRRSKPADLYSDNGTNFVGAKRELQELHRLFRQDESRRLIHNEMSSNGINWHFIPPRAPHYGGLWEAAVRSTKHHLTRVAADGSLTFEEASTLLIQIEAILNSHPLSPISTDPDDCSYLTPGHFLVGDALLAHPEPNLLELTKGRLSRWRHIQQIRHFWKCWATDYLNQLQQKGKWKSSKGPSLRLGQLVIVREDNQPPHSWLTGRVIAVHPGKDGVTRAATVKTVHGELKRPSTKLCIMPIDN